MRLSKVAAALAMAALPASGLQAQYISTVGAPSSAGPAFYSVPSNDGPSCNIGYVLTSPGLTCDDNQMGGGFAAPYSGGLDGVWHAHANGNVGQSVGFSLFTGAGADLTYFGGVAGADPLRPVSVRNLYTGDILHTFTGAGDTYSVAAGVLFDFGIASYEPYSNVPNYFSWSNAPQNQFAVFGNGAFGTNWGDCGDACWIGAEDISGDSDYDYNDGVLSVVGATTVVPEPASVLLVVGGLFGLAVASRRRKQTDA